MFPKLGTRSFKSPRLYNVTGKLMGENHRPMGECIGELKNVEGVLGISIIDRDYDASIVTLVKRKLFKRKK